MDIECPMEPLFVLLSKVSAAGETPQILVDGSGP